MIAASLQAATQLLLEVQVQVPYVAVCVLFQLVILVIKS